MRALANTKGAFRGSVTLSRFPQSGLRKAPAFLQSSGPHTRPLQPWPRVIHQRLDY